MPVHGKRAETRSAIEDEESTSEESSRRVDGPCRSELAYAGFARLIIDQNDILCVEGGDLKLER